MSTSSLARTVVRVQYAALRVPLSVLEQQVFIRYVPEAATSRVAFERLLDLLDAAVNKVQQHLGEQGPTSESAEDPPDPTAAPTSTAPEPTKIMDSSEVSTAGASAASFEEEQGEIERVTEEILDEQPNVFVGELTDLELREVQAKLHAKHLVEEKYEHPQQPE